MARFLLVHGSNHGAWCWRDVIPALEALGHQAEALDLPGSGDDATPPAEVTLASYSAAIRARLNEPTVLVGHSAGGFAITQAAEDDPRHIARLVYLCAYLPRPGASLIELKAEAPEQPLTGALELNGDRSTFRFSDASLAANLYPDCPEVLDYTRAHLGWQALAPQRSPVSYSGQGAALPKSYILCTEDRVIPPAHQRAMAAGLAPEDLHELHTGHSPFFADPEALARLLDRLV
ncbi:MAG: alpha/beta fold hydrolase [Maritimibacter sp.]